MLRCTDSYRENKPITSIRDVTFNCEIKALAKFRAVTTFTGRLSSGFKLHGELNLNLAQKKKNKEFLSQYLTLSVPEGIVYSFYEGRVG